MGVPTQNAAVTETQAIQHFQAAERKLSGCGFVCRPLANGNIIVVPKGGEDSDYVFATVSVAELQLVAEGIRIGWEYHRSYVEEQRQTTTSSVEQDSTT